MVPGMERSWITRMSTVVSPPIELSLFIAYKVYIGF